MHSNKPSTFHKIILILIMTPYWPALETENRGLQSLTSAQNWLLRAELLSYLLSLNSPFAPAFFICN